MKTTVVLIIAFLFSIRLLSQDTLYTKEGKVISGKVIEITQNDIKFKKSSNLDGPLYVISKSEVVVIEYKNGSKDVFTNPSDSNNNASQTTNNNYSSSPYPVYVNPRPAVNVVFGGFPFGYGQWARGWNRGGGYRNYGYHGSYNYHGGYGGHHGGGYGHHR
jgi:hypothetical protein